MYNIQALHNQFELIYLNNIVFSRYYFILSAILCLDNQSSPTSKPWR